MNLSLPMSDTLEEVPAEGAAYGPEPMPTADVVGHGDTPDSIEQLFARLESQMAVALEINSELRKQNNLSTERQAMVEENTNYQRRRSEELERQLQQTQTVPGRIAKIAGYKTGTTKDVGEDRTFQSRQVLIAQVLGLKAEATRVQELEALRERKLFAADKRALASEKRK